MRFIKTTLIASIFVFALISQISASSTDYLTGFSCTGLAEIDNSKTLGLRLTQSFMVGLTHEQEVKFNQNQNRLRPIANRDA